MNDHLGDSTKTLMQSCWVLLEVSSAFPQASDFYLPAATVVHLTRSKIGKPVVKSRSKSKTEKLEYWILDNIISRYDTATCETRVKL